MYYRVNCKCLAEFPHAARLMYRRLHVSLGRSGEHVNHKRVHRVYREAGLMIRRRKRKQYVRVGQPLRAWTAANQEWALDFLHNVVECGRAIRVLSVVDAYTRECLAWEWIRALPAGE
jgi:putative transposase